jgi:hypothetical protein
MLTVGFGFTVTLLTAVLELTQPRELVPITVYEVVLAGLTVDAPLLNVYVLAPPGTMVNTPPAQILPLLTVIVGRDLTVTLLTTAAPRHPAVLVPVTVYVLLDAGDTVVVTLEKVYVLAPEGVMVNTWPRQIVPLLTVTVGNTNTVDATAAVAEQPAVVVPVTL